MRKAYLLVYNAAVGDRDTVKKIVDAMPEVFTWRYDLPNCFYLVSDKNAGSLADAFGNAGGRNGRFIISEITSNHQGWLSDETWHLINNKETKPVK